MKIIGLISYYLSRVFDTIGITSSVIQVCPVLSLPDMALSPFYPSLPFVSQHALTVVREQLLINAILQMWSFFWASFGAFTVERFGRRTLFLSSVAGMTVFFTLQTVCSSLYAQRGTPGASHAVIAMIFLFSSCYS